MSVHLKKFILLSVPVKVCCALHESLLTEKGYSYSLCSTSNIAKVGGVLTSRSTARVILGQVLSIATCGTRTHRGDSL